MCNQPLNLQLTQHRSMSDFSWYNIWLNLKQDPMGMQQRHEQMHTKIGFIINYNMHKPYIFVIYIYMYFSMVQL